MNNTDESCVAAKHLILQETIADTFLDRFKQELERLVPGDSIERGKRIARQMERRAHDGRGRTVPAEKRHNHSIVLLHGGGVDAPDWPLRVSLADLADDVYDGTGRGARSVTRDHRDSFEASKRAPRT
jgi:acyl-CoA reductase-like NAD-dependent aldehyde dehydrogenase